MPTVTSQGTTIEFGGQSLGKVVGVNGSFSSPQKEIRQLSPNLDDATGQYLSIYEPTVCEQSVELESLYTGGSPSALVGQKFPLTITGSGWSITFPAAILESAKVTVKVGDVVRVNWAFKRSYY